jgi:hypothetical protein
MENDWKTQISTGIETILSNPPTEENAAMLAALFVIRDKIGAHIETNKSEADIESDWLLNNITEEFKDCDKYIKAWTDTGDIRFKEMVVDELRHGEILIKMARENGVGEGLMKDVVMLHDVLLARLV